MRIVENSAMVLGALALVACGSRSDVSTSPRLSAATPSFSVGDAGSSAGDHVTGSATIILPAFDNAVERYSIEAKRQADGSVTGEADLM